MAEPALLSEAAITPVDGPEDGPEELTLASSDAHEELKLPRLPEDPDAPNKASQRLEAKNQTASTVRSFRARMRVQMRPMRLTRQIGLVQRG